MASHDSTEVEVEYRGIDRFPRYAIGDDGSVWTQKTRGRGKQDESWKQMKTYNHKDGYTYVSLCVDGIKRTIKVHRLVLETFVGTPPPGTECCHNDGNGWNNRLSNLRWATSKENSQDQVKHGTASLGTRQGLSKLNEDQVREIRERYSQGEKGTHLAREYGVDKSNVYRAIYGKNWGHVE